MSQDKLTRIAIVSNDKCKPKKCRQECRKSCPVVRMGKYIATITGGMCMHKRHIPFLVSTMNFGGGGGGGSP